MSELRQRMMDAMVQRGFAPRTQETYVQAIRRMAKHYRRDPATYTPEEVQAYLLQMVKERKLSYSTMNQAACAAQFLFQTVLGHGREQFHIPFAKVPQRQPELLGREEIARLFAACTNVGAGPQRPARRQTWPATLESGVTKTAVSEKLLSNSKKMQDTAHSQVPCRSGLRYSKELIKSCTSDQR